MKIHNDLAALPPIDTPVEQVAFQQINRAAAPVEAVAPAAADATIIRFASLARLVPAGASISDVLTIAATLLNRSADERTAAWYVYDPLVDRLQATHVTGPAASAIAGTSIAVGDRLTGWVAVQRRPALNSDAALDLGDRASALTLRSCASVPLAAGATLAGVLTVYSRAEAAFTDADLGRLQAIAPHAATALITAARLDGTPLDAPTHARVPASSPAVH